MKSYILIALLLPLLFLQGCGKEEIYVYDVNDVNVNQPGVNKPNIKTDDEFISIAYSDLFGSTISQSELDDLSLAYKAFGDKRLMIDMIIRNLLNDPDAEIPTDAEMRSDPAKFVEDSYKKFFVRKPNEFEKWFTVNLIEADTAFTPEVVYYSFMTANEYRYY